MGNGLLLHVIADKGDTNMSQYMAEKLKDTNPCGYDYNGSQKALYQKVHVHH